MVRSALPQNFVRTAGSEAVLDTTFKNISRWISSKTIASDTTNFISGTNAIKSTETSNGGTAQCELGSNGTPLPTISLKGQTWITFDTYTPDPSAINYFRIFLGSHATSWQWSDALYANVSYGGYMNAGWNHHRVPISGMTAQGASTIASSFTKLRFDVVSATGKCAEVTFDNIRFNQETVRPHVILTFDDIWDSQYSIAYPYLAARGIKGTLMANPCYVGDAGHLTLAQLQEMYAAGWCIANHTYNHADLTTADDETATSEIVSTQEYLIDNAMPRGAYLGAYPFNNHNQHAETLMASLGMLAMRCGAEQGYLSAAECSRPLVYPHDMMRLGTTWLCDCLTATSTLANAKISIDRNIRDGGTMVIMMHQFSDSPTLTGEWLTADFQAMIDYIVQRNVKCITLDEWYNGLTNPRYHSLPPGR